MSALKASRALIILLSACVASTAFAKNVNFSGQPVTLLIGYGAGGGTDLVGRVIAGAIGQFLPGHPTIVVQNMPGAEGTVAANYFANQVTPNGLTFAMCAATQADPLYFRRPQAHFIPNTFKVIGGVERGGTALIIHRTALSRLYNPKAKPVIMGSLGGVPRAGMQAAAWGRKLLSWNLTWVVGYPGTSDLLTALERGEIDMTSTAVAAQLQRFLASGKFAIVSQSGSLEHGRFVAHPAFGNAPILYDLVKSKLDDSLTRSAFRYWADINSMDEWIALPPKTPRDIVRVYRSAYERMIKDPAFLASIAKVGIGMRFRSHQEVKELLDDLVKTPPPAIRYISSMLASQGLKVN